MMKAKPLSEEKIVVDKRYFLSTDDFPFRSTLLRYIATIESKDRLIKVREEAAQDLGKKLEEARGDLSVSQLQTQAAEKLYEKVVEADRIKGVSVEQYGKEIIKLKEENEKLKLQQEEVATKNDELTYKIGVKQVIIDRLEVAPKLEKESKAALLKNIGMSN
jgi:hypothetical protein